MLYVQVTSRRFRVNFKKAFAISASFLVRHPPTESLDEPQSPFLRAFFFVPGKRLAITLCKRSTLSGETQKLSHLADGLNIIAQTDANMSEKFTILIQSLYKTKNGLLREVKAHKWVAKRS